jgi:Rod binding domain-containing protein
MLNSGSCDRPEWALDGLLSRRLEHATRAAPPDTNSGANADELKRTAEDFAALFYTELVKQMQKTVRDEAQDGEDDAAMREGVDDFLTMFLPQALARSNGDSLAAYVHKQLKLRYGELDESA